MELKLVRDVNRNKESFRSYIDNKRKAKKRVGPLLSEVRGT